jgi:type II secretory pathway component HofQ
VRSPRLLAALFFCFLALGAVAQEEKEPTVNLDVQDADTRAVLASLKQQCGIKNLIIDKSVHSDEATFLLIDVPCSTAFGIVARTLSLRIEVEENSVVLVLPRR